MSIDPTSRFSRRQALQTVALAGLGAALPPILPAADKEPALIYKRIPSTGQKLPVVGIGTNEFASADYSLVHDVIQRMYQLGGTVIDTASAYRQSEELIGKALTELNLTDKMFISTKFDVAGVGVMHDPVSGADSIERSFQRLRRIDLMYIHLIAGVESMMPLLQDLKKQGRVRYIGITNVYNPDANDRFVEYLRKYPLDFIQVPYSVGDRTAEKEIFPLAKERKIAVMAATPLGGTHKPLFADIRGRELPAWAAEHGMASWGQFFLKYAISHPAVTCVTPGAAKLTHLEDDLGAGRGELPDAKLRRKMEEFWAQGA